MDIIGMEDRKDRDRIVVRAVMSTDEFERLQGKLDDLVVFSPDTIKVPASAIKTGSRHNHSKYFLVPVKVRKELKGNPFSFEEVRCSVFLSEGDEFIIYKL